MSSSPDPAAPFLAFAHALADESGAVIAPMFRLAIPVDNHNAGRGLAFDPVTEADRGAEQRLFELVSESYPGHAFVGEEYGCRGASGARYTWVIDPIDGTKAFIAGSPLWGTLIGLLDGPTPILGLMDQPVTGDRFWSENRQSIMRQRGRPNRTLACRPCAGPGDAVLASTHPDYFGEGFEQDAFRRLAKATRMTRYGGDCYSYCLLAAGFIDLVVEAGLRAHDITALIPIVENAGGIITTWSGEPAANGGRIVAAGDPRLHEAAMRMLCA